MDYIIKQNAERTRYAREVKDRRSQIQKTFTNFTKKRESGGEPVNLDVKRTPTSSRRKMMRHGKTTDNLPRTPGTGSKASGRMAE